jgi:hypothetical protein
VVAFQVLKVGPPSSKEESRRIPSNEESERSSSNPRKSQRSTRSLMKSMAVQVARKSILTKGQISKYAEVK